jgi:hypothetical protein
MKRIIFTLCIFFALAIAAYSAEFYNCVDKNGNAFITDNPPQDAKCKTSGGDDANTSQQKTNDEDQQATQDDESKQQKKEVKRLIKAPRAGY